MPECTCPADYRGIPDGKRVWLIEPDAVLQKKQGRVIPGPGVHVYHADCPVHGYAVIEEEKQ